MQWFIREKQFYGSKIILTCCTSFLKNKDLLRLKIPRYEIKYTKSEYYKNWQSNWKFSRNLLERSVALSILVKDDNRKIDEHVNDINKILYDL